MWCNALLQISMPTTITFWAKARRKSFLLLLLRFMLSLLFHIYSKVRFLNSCKKYEKKLLMHVLPDFGIFWFSVILKIIAEIFCKDRTLLTSIKLKSFWIVPLFSGYTTCLCKYSRWSKCITIDLYWHGERDLIERSLWSITHTILVRLKFWLQCRKEKGHRTIFTIIKEVKIYSETQFYFDNLKIEKQIDNSNSLLINMEKVIPQSKAFALGYPKKIGFPKKFRTTSKFY